MIIGLSGLAGAGKDTVADMLYRDGFAKVSFADPMKRFCMDLFDFTPDQLWGDSENRNAPDVRYPRPDGGYLTPRHALQTLGTEWGRRCYDMVWIEYALKIHADLCRGGYGYDAEDGIFVADEEATRHVVIPDVRFSNEMQALRQAGAYMVRIVRPGSGLTGDAANHVSEIGQRAIGDYEFDAILDNSGTLEDLEVRVSDLSMRARLSGIEVA